MWPFLVLFPPPLPPHPPSSSPSSSFLLLCSPLRRRPRGEGIRGACTASIQVKRVNISTLWTQVMGASVLRERSPFWLRCFPPSVALTSVHRRYVTAISRHVALYTALPNSRLHDATRITTDDSSSFSLTHQIRRRDNGIGVKNIAPLSYETQRARRHTYYSTGRVQRRNCSASAQTDGISGVSKLPYAISLLPRSLDRDWPSRDIVLLSPRARSETR